mmetsp:Transcript_65632/g.136704  ORF Transcript_65632/g.136704 Transcript_65632/m.136704 type:complete len:374 (+) Transcript_65632:106-1227(+)
MSLASSSEARSDARILFRFGIIADVQYADIPTATSFDGKRKRFYDATLGDLQKADRWWREVCRADGQEMAFIANLGDILDGQNLDKPGDTQRSIKALCQVFADAEYAKYTVHLVGNHELYNFTRQELVEGLTVSDTYTFRATIPTGAEPAQPTCIDPNAFYYAFTPNGAEGKYRIVVLDPYDVSAMRDGGGRHGKELYEGHGMDEEGLALLKQHNHNPVGEPSQIDFFQGLQGTEQRWVPFNGGLGQQQVDWLRKQVETAQEMSQKVILLSHVILHPDATPSRSCRTLLWNFEEALTILREFPGVVPLVLCGHAHQGARVFDEVSKTHHLTVHSPLEHPESYAYCNVLRDGSIQIVGSGDEPSCTLSLNEAAN